MKESSMQKIEYIPIEKLKLNPDNPRVINKDQFVKLVDSVKKHPDYFETRPILVNKDFVIFAGNMRYRAAKEIGLKDVPVAIMDIPEERQREIMMRDNLLNGEWDWDVLANDFDFGELVDFGFEAREVEKLFDLVKEDEFDVDAEIKKITQPKVTYGDVWVLGKHRLVCGDATKEDEMSKIAVGERARLIFTDPPYSVDYKSPAGLGYDSTKFGGTGGKIFNDDKTPEEALEFSKR